MGIELADASAQRSQTESFIQFLTSHPGIKPRSLVSPQSLETADAAFGAHADNVEDPLLELLRNHESLSEERFLETLRRLRHAEFVQK
jgi:hypothetical protein